ncbi:MAG: HAD-IIA family hydrolase [Kiritimatiellaeota bacterium]|nr:HAD-IIA family hydrolase [Kiritimatiellota bacterium]
MDLELFSECAAVVCDLDGTLYLGGRPIPGARDFLEAVIASGRQLFYFTNNSSKSRRTYLERFRDLHFPAADHHLITSTDCAVSYLKREGLGPDIYAVANSDLRAELAFRGFRCLSDEAVAQGRRPAAVLLTFDTELDYGKIRTAYDLILADVPYLATHADTLCPLGPGRFMPDVGSFIALFETASGHRPKVLGKPEPEAVAAISERAGVPSERIAFIGDRLYTDMRMAAASGMVGVLVLSGETRREDLETSPDKPTYSVESVRALLPALRTRPQS